MARTPRPADDDLPEPDRAAGAPHPRETAALHGQARAEAAFLDAFNSGRLHHGWLISGPRGVGKATLAWRLARFLLATPEGGGLFAPPPPVTLDIPDAHPVVPRLRALSEPRLFLLRRTANEKGNALSQVITVDDVRALGRFLHLSAADGGRRAVIVDAADEMNPSAANAILKMLEEPPARVTFLMVAHQPARLLPTIRSRCRTLPLQPLGAPDLAASLAQAGITVDDAAATAELAGGSVGTALQLVTLDGLARYRDLVALMSGLPRLDRPRLIGFAETGAARGTEGRFDLTVTLIDRFLARAALTGITRTPPPEAAPGEAALLSRMAPDDHAARAWADLAQTLGLRARAGKAVNLDPAALLVDMVLKVDETAGRLASR